jgi:hypothetical protein
MKVKRGGKKRKAKSELKKKMRGNVKKLLKIRKRNKGR